MLTAIMGHAELAREGRGGVDENLTAIEQTSVRAAELVRQLLAFARRRAIEPRVLDLNELVTGVEPLLRRLIGEHIALTLGGFAEPRYVNVDRGQLEQVIVNLALNARDAMPNGGSPDITTHRRAAENQVELRVSDSGSGMDASTQTRAFEPFFTTKGVGHGTGLGLATCYGPSDAARP
jgi:signal transduction histidine kinase